MSLTIEQFPMLLLDDMKSELKRYAECDVQQFGTDVHVSCEESNVVKCMEVVAIVDKYNAISINEKKSQPPQSQQVIAPS